MITGYQCNCMRFTLSGKITENYNPNYCYVFMTEPGEHMVNNNVVFNVLDMT